jgi:hypothetical protein
MTRRSRTRKPKSSPAKGKILALYILCRGSSDTIGGDLDNLS